MKNIIDARIWKSKLKSKSSQLLNSNGAIQRYYVFAYRDQQMFCYLLSNKGSLIRIENFITLDIATTVVTERGVADTKELAEILSDVVEVFAHEGKLENPELVPVISILEPSQFTVDCCTFENPSKTFENKNLLDTQELSSLIKKSPYLASETIYELFSLDSSLFISKIPSNINVMYTCKPFLDSWAEVLRLSRLKLAYIGPSSLPVISYLAKKNRDNFIFVDVQCTSSRIFTCSAKQQIVESKFAYGYSQFSSKANVSYDINMFDRQLSRKISALFGSNSEQNIKIFYDGLPRNPATETSQRSKAYCFGSVNDLDDISNSSKYQASPQRNSLSDYLLTVAQLIISEGI